MPANEPIDLQPEDLEALQAEDGPEPSVLVKMEGPIRTQALPHKAAATRTRPITTTAQFLMSADHRRSSVTLIAPASFRFAFSANQAQDVSTMATWPANVPYTLTANVAVWVAAATGTTDISIITEYWATGE